MASLDSEWETCRSDSSPQQCSSEVNCTARDDVDETDDYDVMNTVFLSTVHKLSDGTKL